MTLHVPKGGLMDDAWVKPSDKVRSTKFSKGYMLAQKSIPLFEKAKLRLKVEADVPDKDKLYVVAHRRNKKNELDPDADHRMPIPANYVDGWMECEVDDIGNTFMVDYDDIPPKLTLLNEKDWDKDSTLLVDVRDEQAGLDSFQAYIDGQFILFDYVKKSTRMICSLKDTPIAPNGLERKLQIKAQDMVGNLAIYDTTIIY